MNKISTLDWEKHGAGHGREGMQRKEKAILGYGGALSEHRKKPISLEEKGHWSLGQKYLQTENEKEKPTHSQVWKPS